MHPKKIFNWLPLTQAGFWLGASLSLLVVAVMLLVFGREQLSAGLAWLPVALLAVAFIGLGYYFIHGYYLDASDSSKFSKDLAEITLQSIGEGVITTDTRLNITHMNPLACQLTGYDCPKAFGQPLHRVLQLVDESSRNEIETTAQACLLAGTTVELEKPALLVSIDGREHSIETSASPIADSEGDFLGSVIIIRDITRVRNLSRKLEFQAKHDSLTNLINRREFEQQLKHAIHSARDSKQVHTLCYIDLDQFKIVNDTCGHIAGDQLLREIAKLMPFSIRSSDCLARLGGDEFGVLMFDCPPEEAIRITEDLRNAISEFKFTWDKKIFDIGASIGLVGINADSGSLQDIMRRADASCYIAKDLGRNRIHVYAEDDLEHARRRDEMLWLAKINNTLKEDRFKLAVQPVRPIDGSNNKHHYEVLLRMEDEEGRLVPPTSFLPAAERYDMMPTIDRWVITTALDNISKDLHHASDHVYNINLSGQTLRDDSILKFICEQVENYHVPAAALCFEITETSAIANLGFARELINELKNLGCEFALDDFGSGLSSFAYLKKLPVDYLKIDGVFISDALTNHIDRAIVMAINTIGHEMGLKTVAEYVDSDSTLSLMKELGVNYAQGYAIEKPSAWGG